MNSRRNQKSTMPDHVNRRPKSKVGTTSTEVASHARKRTREETKKARLKDQLMAVNQMNSKQNEPSLALGNLFFTSRRINEGDVMELARVGKFSAYMFFDFKESVNGSPFVTMEQFPIDDHPAVKLVRKEGMTAAAR